MSKKSYDRYNLLDIASQFDEYLSQKNLSKISRKNYLSDIRFFLTWVDAHFDMPNFDLSTIISYKKFLVNSRQTVRSINRSLSSVRAYGDLLVQKQLEFSNPARLVANVPIRTTFSQDALIHEFSRTNDLSHEDRQALYEFLKLTYEHS